MITALQQMKPIPLTGANSAFQMWTKELGQNDKVFAMKKQYLSMYLSRLTAEITSFNLL